VNYIAINILMTLIRNALKKLNKKISE